MNIKKYFAKSICKWKGHTYTILEVHILKDVIRCSRCNTRLGRYIHDTN